MNEKNILQSMKVIILSLILSVGMVYAYAQTPPLNNVPGPLNVGTSAQIKNGDLSVNGFLATINSAFLGKVGIGVSVPKDTLHVAGNIVQPMGGFLMTNMYVSSGLKYLGNGYGSLIRLNGGNLEFNIASNNTSGAGAPVPPDPMNKVVITSTGKVGIGMVAPQATLDVGGNIKATGTTVGTLKVTGGIPSIGKVLTSDTVGNATWQVPTNLFGGTYSKYYSFLPSPTWVCDLKNPLADDTCSCPSGFTEYLMFVSTKITALTGHSNPTGSLITGSTEVKLYGCYR